MSIHTLFSKAVRRRVEAFVCDGATLYRAHVWNQTGAYSSKTFMTSGEAMHWQPSMEPKK